MAPPPTAAWAASADLADAESLEVRCAGCGETLEVDRGLTEFICPDCATPQSLPPELMPPPPPRRKALPLPRSVADLRGARLPCGACGALLSVPVRMLRCACPLCGAELAVDTARLRHYLLSSATAADAVPVVPLGASSSEPPILQVRQAHTEHADQFMPEPPESEHPDYTIGGEEVHGVSEDTMRYQEQRNIYPDSSRIVCAEKRHGEPISQVRHQAQHLTSSHAIGAKQSHQQNPDRVIESLQNPVNSAPFTQSGRAADINDTTSTDINGPVGQSICPRTISVERRIMQTAQQITQKSQKQLSYYVRRSANGTIHAQEKQQEPGNKTKDREEACTQLVNVTVSGSDNRGRRQLIGLDVMGSERRQEQTTNDAIQEVRREHSESVIRREMDNQVTHIEPEQPGRHRVHARKRKGLVAASNSVLQLRRSKRLAKGSSAAVDRQLAMGTELTHRQTVGRQADSLSGLMPTSIIDYDQTESETDEQLDVSPVRSSDLSDTNRIINNLCNSSLPSPDILQTCSHELENLHMTTLPCSNHDMSDAEQFSSNPDMADPEDFARTYIPLDVRKALAKLDSKSSPHHMTSQQSSGEAYLQDSMGSGGQEVQLASQRKATMNDRMEPRAKGRHDPHRERQKKARQETGTSSAGRRPVRAASQGGSDSSLDSGTEEYRFRKRKSTDRDSEEEIEEEEKDDEEDDEAEDPLFQMGHEGGQHMNFGMLEIHAPHVLHYIARTNYKGKGMTRIARDQRRIDPRGLPRIQYDHRFHTQFHADFYSSVILSRNPVIAKSEWVDWAAFRELQKNSIDHAIAICQRVGAYQIMEFQHDWNSEAIAQFYATLYVEEDTRRMHWMTEGSWHSVDYEAFAAYLGFTEEDLQRDKIHSELPLPPEQMGFMYPAGGQGVAGKVLGLHPTYRYLERVFRRTIDCKGGDKGTVAEYSKNLLQRMAPGARPFSVFDFIWSEIRSVGERPLKGCGFAPYIMYMIEQVTEHTFEYDCRHKVLRLTIDLPETHTPPPGPGAPATATEDAPAAGAGGAASPPPRAPSRSTSRRGSSPSPIRKFFSALFGMFKDVDAIKRKQHHERKARREYSRTLKMLHEHYQFQPPRSPPSEDTDEEPETG